MAGLYTIKDLEILSGIKAHTIRIWEKRFQILSPIRTASNLRRYTDDDLKKLLNISLLIKGGMKISQIASFELEQINKKAWEVTGNYNYTTIHIEKLIQCMIDMNYIYLQQLINEAVLKIGFEEAIFEVIFPFFERIGALWLADAIFPAQEHFVFNYIRQKLIAETDKIPTDSSSQATKALFFLPEGEQHEFSLLFYNYLARKQGHQTIYLGQSVPLQDIEQLIDTFSFDYLFAAILVPPKDDDFHQFIVQIAQRPKTKLYLTGPHSKKYQKSYSSNIKVINNPKRFKQYME